MSPSYNPPGSFPWPVSPGLQRIRQGYQMIFDIQMIELQKQSWDAQVAAQQAQVAAQQKTLRHQQRQHREAQSAHALVKLCEYAIKHPEHTKLVAGLVGKGYRLLQDGRKGGDPHTGDVPARDVPATNPPAGTGAPVMERGINVTINPDGTYRSGS